MTANALLLAAAPGNGSLVFSHVNDAGFRLVKEYFGMTVGQTLAPGPPASLRLGAQASRLQAGRAQAVGLREAARWTQMPFASQKRGRLGSAGPDGPPKTGGGGDPGTRKRARQPFRC